LPLPGIVRSFSSAAGCGARERTARILAFTKAGASIAAFADFDNGLTPPKSGPRHCRAVSSTDPTFCGGERLE
jgi:hypothetical protein